MANSPSAVFLRLRAYIAERMRMSHIYQPLMLMELLGRSSPAPAQDVARRILGSGWWARFTFNGITAYGITAYSLIGGDVLSDAERDVLQQLCRQRLDAFREQRGEEVLAYRSRHRSPISGSVKYRVLIRARGRCECCVAHEHQRALKVDHIIPKNQGGSEAITNLQALCFRCNAGKRDGCFPTQEGAQTFAACRPATATAKRAVCFCALELIAERMLGGAEHVRNSMLGRGERTHSDQILITNRSEAG